jgi:hypothetical protein
LYRKDNASGNNIKNREIALKAILLAQIKFFALLKVCVLFAKFVIE